jgi:hypothetical protein
MRKVHWSVWGFVGFFGMLSVGLWIDSYWLPGVGVTTPLASNPARAIVNPVPQDVVVASPISREVPAPCGETCECQAAPSDMAAADAGETACAAVEGKPEACGPVLEFSEITLPESPELIPEPEMTAVPSSLEPPLERSAAAFQQLAIPLGPVAAAAHPAVELPPARAPIVTNEGTTAKVTETAKTAPGPQPQVHDSEIDAMLELRTPSVISSPELAPDERSRAQCRRELADALRRLLEQHRAAVALTPPPQQPPQAQPPQLQHPIADWTGPPLPPQAVTTEAPPMSPVSPEQVEFLRNAAEQLDQIANQLERQNLYPRADQMRGLSQQLRLDARKGSQQRPLSTVMPPARGTGF